MGKALTVSSYPPISASTSVNVVSPRGVINKITRRTMYEIVVPTEMRLRFGPYGGGYWTGTRSDTRPGCGAKRVGFKTRCGDDADRESAPGEYVRRLRGPSAQVTRPQECDAAEMTG